MYVWHDALQNMKQKIGTDDQNIQHIFPLNCFPLPGFDHSLTFENSKKALWPHYPLGLNIHLVPIFVNFIQFGPYFRFMLN